MACEPFTVQFSGSAETLFNRVTDLIQQHRGTLETTSAHHIFSIPVPFFGTVAGYFVLKTSYCTITITQHSHFLPCTVIQQFVHSTMNKQDF